MVNNNGANVTFFSQIEKYHYLCESMNNLLLTNCSEVSVISKQP